LLGPEGANSLELITVDSLYSARFRKFDRCCEYRPYLENYTVNASIF